MTIRVIPHTGDRVETGPIQFGDDWPGVFIRGDNAMAIAIALKNAAAEMKRKGCSDWDVMQVEDVRRTLAKCDARTTGNAGATT